MKVLFLIPSLGSGGAERVTATLANYWAEKGWDITIATMASSERDFYALNDRVRRVALDLARESRSVTQALVNNCRRIAAVGRVLRRERPDVAVGMMPTANVTLALAACLTGIPSVGSERAYPPMLPLGRVWQFLRQRTYTLLNGLVAQTSEGAAWLHEHARAPRIAVIPNPIQLPLTKQSPQVPPVHTLSSLPGNKVLLAVGRLEAEKGFDRLMTTFSRIASRHPDWSLVILGQGSLRGALTGQATELGIGDRVALPGAVGNVEEWYEAGDLYALTSRFEGFPNTLLEALACGLPSVAVDCQTGPREIVRHGVDGLLVPQDDPEALATALDRLMGDGSLRERFSVRAIEARERFAIESVAARWETLFADV